MRSECLFIYLWIFSSSIFVILAIRLSNDNDTFNFLNISDDSIFTYDPLMFQIETSTSDSSISATESSAISIVITFPTTMFESTMSSELTNTTSITTTTHSQPTTESSREQSINAIRNPNRTQDDLNNLIIGNLNQLVNQLTTEENHPSILSPTDIDKFIESLNTIISKSDNQTFAIVAKPIEQNGTFLIGIYLQQGHCELEVNNETRELVLNSNFTAGVIVESQSLKSIDFISVAIFARPIGYINVAETMNDTLVSPVLIVSTRQNNRTQRSTINLYFELLSNETLYDENRYTCSFYNNSNFRWESTGCSRVRYNPTHNRFECQCDHQTTFALLFLPNLPTSRHFDAQDITSISTLSISIISFVLVIAHSLTSRLRDPWTSIEARDLLPLISAGTTTLLFILFIVMSLTVYLQKLTEQCSISTRILMYFVYFSLILMFGVKTSVGYFNYIRFVRLFPEPSFRRLNVFLVVSIFISVAYTSFVVGFDQNSSINITQVHAGKLCWFTRDVLHYFLTIPIGLFLLINTVMIICVVKHIFRYVRNVSTAHLLYERRKRCVIVILSSCLTQGIGWFFGLFLSFMFPSLAIVMSWIFTVFNGFEGLWTIILYWIIRSKKMDHSKRTIATKQLFYNIRNKTNMK